MHEAEFEPSTELMKEVLGDRGERVVVSSRLAGSPRVHATSERGWSTNSERLMWTQAMRDSSMASNVVSPRCPLHVHRDMQFEGIEVIYVVIPSARTRCSIRK